MTFVGLRKKPRTPNYRTVHQRLKRAHGPATAHLCQDCGRQADEWSYDNADPDEGIDPDNECPYSIDLEHYLTRCKSCHRQADYARRVRHRIPLPAAACVQLYYVSDTPLKTISLLFDYSTDDILDELHNAGIPINKPGSAWKWRVRKRTGQRNAEKRRLHRENMMKIQNRDKIESQEQEQNPTR